VDEEEVYLDFLVGSLGGTGIVYYIVTSQSSASEIEVLHAKPT
jgi:hypothetical protein